MKQPIDYHEQKGGSTERSGLLEFVAGCIVGAVGVLILWIVVRALV